MPRIALRMVDFPDPDSPTIPRVELADKEKLSGFKLQDSDKRLQLIKQKKPKKKKFIPKNKRNREKFILKTLNNKVMVSNLSKNTSIKDTKIKKIPENK